MTTREQRIVSLLPSATEIICALGLEGDLVGVTHECDYPPSVRGKPVVTSSIVEGARTSGEIDRHIRRMVHEGSSIYSLDADRLQALDPDLIVTQELCEVCAVSYPIVEQAVRRLEGSTQLISLEPETLDDLYQTIRSIGRITDRAERAQALIAELAGRIAAVRHQVRSQPVRPIVCLEWVDPLFNCGHWTPELVAIAGGRDLLGTPGRPAHPIANETLAGLRPDVIVVMACGFPLDRSVEEARRADGAIQAHDAELWVVDGNAYFSRPGPRLVDSAEILAGILHPGAVAPPPEAAAIRLN